MIMQHRPRLSHRVFTHTSRCALALGLLLCGRFGHTVAAPAATPPSGARPVASAGVEAAAPGDDATAVAGGGTAPAHAAKLRRGYVDMRYGQLHYQMATPSLPMAARKRPLIMFHQSPLSSMELAAIAAEMGSDRVTVAVDTPGQGFSDGPTEVPTIADYAAAIDEALHRLGYDAAHPIDVLGNHTGAFIAGELAIREPAMVKRLVLAGVYVVPEERRLKAVAGLSHPANSAQFYDQLCQLIPVLEKYYSEQNLDDAVWGRVLASSLMPLTRREYGHEAAFAYAATVTARLPLIPQPVLLLAMNDGIGGPTKDSARFFQHAQLKDFPDFKEGAFTTHARELAGVLRAYLN
jgi:pimeloyl-ACP methyl ester carboxylesterase